MEVDVVVSGSKAIEISFETKVIGSLKTPDSALSTTSENSVQNKVVTKELEKKVNKTDIATINGQPLTEGGNIEVVADSYDDTELKEQIADLSDAVTRQGTKTALNEAEIGQLKDSKADKEGYYSSLVAGAAENLVNTSGDGVVRELTYDTAGGTADIGTGTAIIKRMRGKSLVWNQLIKLKVGTSTNKGLTFTIDSEVVINGISEAAGALSFASITPYLIKGHKYYLAGCPSGGTSTTYYLTDQTNAYDYGNGVIFTATYASGERAIVLRYGADVTFSNLVFRPVLFDLTQMFGAGNEPATIEEFKRLFPRDDYSYNEGEVIHFNGRRLLTTGFNQWDEQREEGSIGTASTGGVNEDGPSAWRTTGYIRVFPNTAYYINAGGINKSVRARFYDAAKQYITSYSANGKEVLSDTIFTTKANVAYMRLAPFKENIPMDTPICVNLSWSGYRNGEYEPYEEHILELPYGVYGDGLKSAGTAYDEVTEEKYVKRIGVVDMGSLAWSVFTTMNGLSRTQATIPDFVGGVELEVSNILCAKFATIQSRASMLGYEPLGIFGFTNNRVFVLLKEGDYADAASFKAAMAGVMLYYELVEPEVTEFETPLNLGYYVNDFGTEMILPENGIAPFTAPTVFDILYAMNAVDTLRNLPTNYISKESFDNFTAALSSALANAGITMSIKATFNEETGAYNYTITASKTE